MLKRKLRRLAFPHAALFVSAGVTAFVNAATYWFRGQPTSAISTTGMNAQKYWFQGVPGPDLVG